MYKRVPASATEVIAKLFALLSMNLLLWHVNNWVLVIAVKGFVGTTGAVVPVPFKTLRFVIYPKNPEIAPVPFAPMYGRLVLFT
jgi:hypothetical protein